MKTITTEEQKRIEQLQLQIDWIREGFTVQVEVLCLGEIHEWQDCFLPLWEGGNNYRRKPSPKYVPWTEEDIKEFRGLWVRHKKMGRECLILQFHPNASFPLRVDREWISFEALAANYTKLDGMPCGKGVE